MRLRLAAAAALTLCFLSGASAAAPAPHFVALKAESANGRQGPGLEHRVEWIYERAGLPLLVLAEQGVWRRVRDPDGAEVWMHAANLEERRTVFVMGAAPAALRRTAHESAKAVALLAPGVVGALTGCEGAWRRVAIGGRVGWVMADALWGAGECG